ncbi:MULTISPECIES: TM2 domain-containing protein [unclassified Paenarthrobacter]|uniref:TM2 domain-containing protein n=1 Tax=unclassified Paenarthrobacter TaxID=2634190 RepID=UPI001F1FA147|nr:TM2 domain-containing protein [Paenarthrobacter sp. AR 02]MCF3140493.1 NINE protein [Paenarthrobacter sp. AR 02]
MTSSYPDQNPTSQGGQSTPPDPYPTTQSPLQFRPQEQTLQPPHYSAQPPAPQPPQFAAQPATPSQPQYSAQPPLPNPAYGYPQPKSKIAAGLFGIFLGGLGIHRFYLGYTTIGIIQLVLTVVVGIFTFGLVGLWGLVEGIMILAGASYFQRDAHGVPLRD